MTHEQPRTDRRVPLVVLVGFLVVVPTAYWFWSEWKKSSARDPRVSVSAEEKKSRRGGVRPEPRSTPVAPAEGTARRPRLRTSAVTGRIVGVTDGKGIPEVRVRFEGGGSQGGSIADLEGAFTFTVDRSVTTLLLTVEGPMGPPIEKRFSRPEGGGPLWLLGEIAVGTMELDDEGELKVLEVELSLEVGVEVPLREAGCRSVLALVYDSTSSSAEETAGSDPPGSTPGRLLSRVRFPLSEGVRVEEVKIYGARSLQIVWELGFGSTGFHSLAHGHSDALWRSSLEVGLDERLSCSYSLSLEDLITGIVVSGLSEELRISDARVDLVLDGEPGNVRHFRTLKSGRFFFVTGRDAVGSIEVRLQKRRVTEPEWVRSGQRDLRIVLNDRSMIGLRILREDGTAIEEFSWTMALSDFRPRVTRPLYEPYPDGLLVLPVPRLESGTRLFVFTEEYGESAVVFDEELAGGADPYPIVLREDLDFGAVALVAEESLPLEVTVELTEDGAPVRSSPIRYLSPRPRSEDWEMSEIRCGRYRYVCRKRTGDARVLCEGTVTVRRGKNEIRLGGS